MPIRYGTLLEKWSVGRDAGSVPVGDPGADVAFSERLYDVRHRRGRSAIPAGSTQGYCRGLFQRFGGNHAPAQFAGSECAFSQSLERLSKFFNRRIGAVIEKAASVDHGDQIVSVCVGSDVGVVNPEIVDDLTESLVTSMLKTEVKLSQE